MGDRELTTSDNYGGKFPGPLVSRVDDLATRRTRRDGELEIGRYPLALRMVIWPLPRYLHDAKTDVIVVVGGCSDHFLNLLGYSIAAFAILETTYFLKPSWLG